MAKLHASALGPVSHIPGCRDVPGCSSPHGGDTSSTLRLAPAPRPVPAVGRPFPLGTSTFQAALWPRGSPWLDHVHPPLPGAIQDSAAPSLPSPRAGTDGVCPDLMSILDFPARSQGPGSGRASPHRPHRRGFHSPTVRAQPGGRRGARCLRPCGQRSLCPRRNAARAGRADPTRQVWARQRSRRSFGLGGLGAGFAWGFITGGWRELGNAFEGHQGPILASPLPPL